jgi:hypothetical protein
MIRFEFPTELGNEIVRSGKIKDVFERLLADLQPEAAYFFPSNGNRAGVLFVNMDESADVARKTERLWFGLGARVELTPVMNGDDLMQGLEEMPTILERFG